MRYIAFHDGQSAGLAIDLGNGCGVGLREHDSGFPGWIEKNLTAGADAVAHMTRVLRRGSQIDIDAVRILPPLRNPSKIVCIGLNYAEHAKESAFKEPDYPAVFARFPSSLIGHRQPIVRSGLSSQLDYEGELVAIVGRTGRHIPEEVAMDYIAGWSIFNDASFRDYQFKGAQWTMGKNFDASGAFGPAFVTSDEIPAGAKGLRLQTRLNGTVVQDASTSDMIFDVSKLVAMLSSVMTLEPGDVIVTGTPSGVGVARKPPIWMKDGDVVEIEIEGLGILSNPVKDEAG